MKGSNHFHQSVLQFATIYTSAAIWCNLQLVVTISINRGRHHRKNLLQLWLIFLSIPVIISTMLMEKSRKFLFFAVQGLSKVARGI